MSHLHLLTDVTSQEFSEVRQQVQGHSRQPHWQSTLTFLIEKGVIQWMTTMSSTTLLPIIP
jgi:hypothetical protein